MSRRKARWKALQALFAADVGRMPAETALAQVLEEGGVSPVAGSFARALVSGVAEKRKDLDAVLEKYAIGWQIQRMSAVDRNILRLGLYELVYLGEEIPPSVAINEAVELAKAFSDEEAGAFINGVLDSIRRDLEAGKIRL